MSIEKMVLVNIVGSLKSLDKTLLHAVQSELFHIENIEGGKLDFEFGKLSEQNPYIELMTKSENLMEILDICPVFSDYNSLNMDINAITDKVDELYTIADNASKEKSKLINLVELREQSLLQIKHISGLDADLDDVFSSKYSSARFGRLPTDSYLKLDYFKNKDFYFFPFDKDDNYYWGVYFMPATKQADIDEIFKSLFFEEYLIPDYIKGTPDLAIESITKQIRSEKISIEANEITLNNLKKENEDFLLKIYSKIKMLHDTFNYRKYAVVFKNKFRLEGFVPKNQIDLFVKQFDHIDEIIIDTLPPDANSKLDPPVKLNTCKLFRPFEMFVEIYGLPNYNGINPSSFIGVIYSLLFGIMFGDFGQGAIVIIFGLLLYKIKKMMLGRILVRCGVSSMIFGFMYGSFFGFEDNFHSIWNALGLGNVFPLDVLNSETSLVLLILSLGLGVFVILISICINIYLGFKRGDLSAAVFSHNGLAGLLMYSGVIIAAIAFLILDINLFSPIFLILVVFIPIILIFFHQPLGRFISKHKSNADSEKFSFIDASFEMIEILLSYCTNSLSFLRVGGFILCHAALMLVVMQFSHMAGGFGSPIVIIIGNIFVMGLEGLIVGIQVLRLVYYETFSRFYISDGKAFNPARVVFNKQPKK